MKNNENTITDIWYYTNKESKNRSQIEVFFFKFKKNKIPLRIQLNLQEDKFYKCIVDYKMDIGRSIVNNNIRNFKKLELYEIEFEEKYKTWFKFILNLEDRRIMIYNKTAQKLFFLLLEELEKIVKGDELCMI